MRKPYRDRTANHSDLEIACGAITESRFVADSGCLEWPYSVDGHGYGQVKDARGKQTRIHRLVYESLVGPAAELEILHSCDNPRCISLVHMTSGTHKENAAGMVERRRSASGQRHGMAKLTEAVVLEMRRKRSSERVTYAELASQYGVSSQTCSEAVRGITWRHA